MAMKISNVQGIIISVAISLIGTGLKAKGFIVSGTILILIGALSILSVFLINILKRKTVENLPANQVNISNSLNAQGMVGSHGSTQINITSDDTSRQLLTQKRFEECEAKFKKHAPLVCAVIDTYDDMSNEEKADFFDEVAKRVKGRPLKHNKYRNNNT